MTTPEIQEKFGELESQIATDRGGFTLFALFMREDVPDRWDLIISAPWTGTDNERSVAYFVDEIKSRLGDSGLISLARIVIADPEHPSVQAINRMIQVEHGKFKVRDGTFLGLPVKHATFITSKKRPPAAAA